MPLHISQFILSLLLALPLAPADEIEELINRLDEKDYEKRSAIEKELEKQVREAHIPFLVSKIGKNYLVNYSLIQVLESIGGKQAVLALRGILQGKNPSNAYSAYLALSRLKDEWARRYVLDLLVDPSRPDTAKRNFVNALYGIPTEKAVPILRHLLTHAKDSYLRTRAIQLLGDRGDTTSLNVLKKILDDEKENENVRAAAAVTLVRLGDTASQQLVRDLIRGGKISLTDLNSMLSALLTPQQAKPYFDDLRKLLADSKEKYIRTRILEFLARMGDTKLLELIDQLLEDEEEEVATAAIRAVGTLCRTPDKLRKFQHRKEFSARIRLEIAGALLLADDFSSLEFLIAESANPEVKIRTRAVEQLGKACIDEAIEPLLARLADDQVPVRKAAKKSLQKTLLTLFPYRTLDWKRLDYQPEHPDPGQDQTVTDALRHWINRTHKHKR